MKKLFVTLLMLTVMLAGIAGCDVCEVQLELNEYFENYEGFNGSVLVAENNKIVLVKGYGKRNFEEDLDNSAFTVFNIASLTKQFTAMAIMMLVENGSIDTDDVITSYVPELTHAQNVTIKQCLNHTSGLPEYLAVPDLWNHTTQQHDPEMLLSYYKDLPLDFEPGTSWAYCNTNYVTLGIIIERVSGMDYNSFLQQNIFQPLQMHSTLYDYTGELSFWNEASGYDAISPLTPTMNFHQTIAFSAGAIDSTALDLYKWSKALDNESLVSEETLDQIFTPNEHGYGYGWFIDSMTVEDQELAKKWHWGSFFGYGSYIALVEGDITVIILENITASSPDRHAAMVQDVIEIMN